MKKPEKEDTEVPMHAVTQDSVGLTSSESLKRWTLDKSLKKFEKENPTVNDQARTDFTVGFDYGWDEFEKCMEKVLDEEIKYWKWAKKVATSSGVQIMAQHKLNLLEILKKRLLGGGKK